MPLHILSVDTPDGFQKLAPGKLTASTVNRHLRRLGYDHERMTRQPPAARFQAEYANPLSPPVAAHLAIESKFCARNRDEFDTIGIRAQERFRARQGDASFGADTVPI